MSSSEAFITPPQSLASPVVSGSPAACFTVRFWGVRGSIPTPGIATARYGGNTACIEIKVAGKHLIFDGGTGLRVLGKHLSHPLNHQPVQAHLFFTHTYWDRIQGFPFFIPAFLEGNRFDVYGTFGQNGASIKQRLSDQMLRPHFPAPLQEMRSHLQFHNITPGARITLDDVIVETLPLNGCSTNALGYRVTWGDRSIVYAIDNEQTDGQSQQNLAHLAQQTDLLICDTAYADHTYYGCNYASTPRSNLCEQPKIWQAGIDLAIATQAKKTILFHHDPDHEDDFLDQIETEMQQRFPSIQIAREGMILLIP